MRTVGLMVLLFVVSTAHTQTLTFIDSHSKQRVEGVFVKIIDANSSESTFISSERGTVNVLSGARFPIIVQASHVGFITKADTLTTVEDRVLSLTPASRQLADVVVTGQYEPQSAKKSVYQVRTITNDRIAARGAVQLQDVLNSELNIRFSQDLALGGSNLSMQGLSGQNVKILIDGVPMTGRQGTSNEININQININSIERVEIVEGPMSVVYGADALAGVINIITKKPEEDKLILNARIHEETVGTEYDLSRGIHNQHVGALYQKNGFQLGLDGSRNVFGGWQGDAVGRDRMWNPKTQWLGSVMTGYRNDALHAYYRLDALHETIENPGVFQGTEALDQEYITTRLMHQIQTNAQLSDRFSMNVVASYTDFERRTVSTTLNAITGDRRLALGAGQQDVTRFDGKVLRGIGLFKATDNVSIQAGADINLESGSGGRIKTGTQSMEDYAFFASTELTFDRISIRPGVRIIYNSVYDAPPAIPSINTRIRLTDALDLRLAYGRGFRAPALRELYFNFFDASHAVEGNTDLKAELSHSTNALINLETIKRSSFAHTLIVGGFYNDLTNRITTGARPNDPRITTYINVDRYKTTGMNVSNVIKANRLTTTLGYAYIGQYNEFSEQIELPQFVWSHEFNLNASFRIPVIETDLNIFYKYTGKTPFYEVGSNGDPRLVEIGDFHWADLTLNKMIGKYTTLSIGARNVLDVVMISNTSQNTGAAHSTAGARPVGYGRSYFAGINFQWR